jgi:hypothetical protein
MTRQDEFKQKLMALLREYNVTMSAEVVGPDDSPVVDFFAKGEWDENGDIKHDCITFQIAYENGKE